eukprot:TRINITY_DN3235_c0_g1_i3.p1 TRINITY_DN3235_c0_g1~~TRINITY_DN3235_c0_g1_i3.p1  ORF type:complete len:368 (+),score=91.22 TRINITY_DN3235_c0_g1_i3:82-1185(+)
MVDDSSAQQGNSVAFQNGQCVEIFGLSSDSGKLINGERGLLTEFIKDTGRWQVRLGAEKTVSLKPDNLKKVELSLPVVSGRQLQPDARHDKRSRSRSSSSSSSSSSSRPRSAEPQGHTPPLKTGEEVSIFGLTSDAGKPLNGQKGILTDCSLEKGRWDVMLSLEKVVSLKDTNLRRVAHLDPTRQHSSAQPTKKKTKAEGSLAALLGLGKPKEEAKEEVPAEQKKEWQPIWARSSSAEAQAAVAGAAMSQEQIEYLKTFTSSEDKEARKEQKRADKVRRELAAQGIVVEEMVQEVIRQREEERRQLILFRGPAAARDSSSSPEREQASGHNRRRSRSASVSSSSSSSSSKSRKGKEAAKPPAADGQL